MRVASLAPGHSLTEAPDPQPVGSRLGPFQRVFTQPRPVADSIRPVSRRWTVILLDAGSFNDIRPFFASDEVKLQTPLVSPDVVEPVTGPGAATIPAIVAPR